MKVLHVITRMILGGAQENTLYTVLGLARIPGVTVRLLTGPAEGPEGELIEAGRAQGADIRVLPQLVRSLSPACDLAALLAIRREIREFRPDVIHTHSSKAGILGRMAGRACGVPAVVHTIHGLPFHPYEKLWRNAVYVRAERFAARLCDRIICVADAMTAQALAAGVGSPEQFVTIHSGMDVESFTQCGIARDDARARFGVPARGFVIAKVARLFEHKGHDDVLEAAVHVIRAEPEAHFLFVGDGRWRPRLEHKAHSLGVDDHVTFAGLVPASEIPAVMRAADLVVHASYREGLPRVVPQALLSDVPVVCYDLDGAPEVCIHGETGLRVEPGDVAGLARAMIALASDPASRTRMAAAGRRLCEKLFPIERMVRRILAEYRRLLPAVE